jgi:hypothetical protein
VILYMLGHRRLATADAKFFFHEVRALGNGVDGVMICDLEEALYEEERIEADQREFLEEWRRQMRAAQAWFVEFLARRLDVPPSDPATHAQAGGHPRRADALRYDIPTRSCTSSTIRPSGQIGEPAVRRNVRPAAAQNTSSGPIAQQNNLIVTLCELEKEQNLKKPFQKKGFFSLKFVHINYDVLPYS